MHAVRDFVGYHATMEKGVSLARCVCVCVAVMTYDAPYTMMTIVATTSN